MTAKLPAAASANSTEPSSAETGRAEVVDTEVGRTEVARAEDAWTEIGARRSDADLSRRIRYRAIR